MSIWFTRPGARVEQATVKRFAAVDWTVDFPRGTIASTVTTSDERGVTVEAEYLRKGDLVGLIYESEDRYSHRARMRESERDYSRCQLRFRWKSTGLMALDAVNGPTLTIEGRDAGGAARSWYVRLWNYAVGGPTDAKVTLDFDALDGGYVLPAEAERVYPKDIDRMFFSLVPPAYIQGSSELISAPAMARLEISEIASDGSGSVLGAGDAWAPEHGYGAATAYDDMYNLAPERVVRSVEAAGFRGTIVHYVGMSHYLALGGDGLVDPAREMNAAALAWHRDFARAAKMRGFAVIWSLSYEILDMFCPVSWKQRAHDGAAAATGYEPPSTLVSPASAAGISYLGRIAANLVGLSVAAGLAPQFQVGEPWWWVRGDGAICCYDDAAKAALGGEPVVIADLRENLSGAQKALLDRAGAILASSTVTILAAAKAAAPGTRAHLLTYLPGVLDPAVPEVRRANLPLGWARPSFDVLQLEDYEWVTTGRRGSREVAYATVAARLDYAPAEQHYFSGFVAGAAEREQWRAIIDAAREAEARGVAKTFIWAMPQWLRDGVTMLGKENEVVPFEDVDFPIAIGAEASVAPSFSTNVVTSASGHEFRNANWSQSRLRFDAGPGVRGEGELGVLIEFFRARRGPAIGFRFRDPFDWSSKAMGDAPSFGDQVLGVGDGVRTSFALVKHYGEGEERRITRPIAGSVVVSVNGTERSSGWVLDPMGIVRFDAAPAAGASIAAGFLFDVPVRFADDRIEVNRATFLAGEAPSVPLIEVREG
ncbi:MAG: DUF2460 domain-containing protein [Sphingomonas sp.]|uniref:DUF2460 domain-containing protein n=1 Tax=Sphingomonas sp. TaxID=28214 RepID=UPI0017EE43A8|nr:DUF2460 domain-containing protein [Sphingomonas sp.]MBA3667754.1 DUF2460 domain-containing protein [Sphingomonas sp.]